MDTAMLESLAGLVLGLLLVAAFGLGAGQLIGRSCQRHIELKSARD